MSRLLRRAFSSLPPRAGPSTPRPPHPPTFIPSAASLTSTLPQAVRRRRELHLPHPETSPSPLSDPDLHDPSTGKRFPFELEQDYQAILRDGDFPSADIPEAELRGKFLQGMGEWRSRVRGYKERGRKGRLEFVTGVMGGTLPSIEQEGADSTSAELDADGQSKPKAKSSASAGIIGQRIYLPNIQIRLMRNHTPPTQPYDPWIATFRIPPSMTKTDLRSYLLAVYDLKVTFIRTDNYIAPVGRNRTGAVVRTGGKGRTYKRAVVGLNEPFHYPDDMEELYAQGAQNGMGDKLALARDAWLQEHYSLRMSEEARKRAMFKYYKGSRWRSKTHANLGNTVQEIMKRRKEREEKVKDEVRKRYAQIAQEDAKRVAQPQAA